MEQIRSALQVISVISLSCPGEVREGRVGEAEEGEGGRGSCLSEGGAGAWLDGRADA